MKTDCELASEFEVLPMQYGAGVGLGGDPNGQMRSEAMTWHCETGVLLLWLMLLSLEMLCKILKAE